MNIRACKTGLSFVSMLTGTLLASIAAPSRGQDASDAKWQYEITPYLWAAGISGDIGLGPISTHTSASFSDILQRLDFGAMGAFEARKDRWGVLFDGMYIKLSNSEDIARGRVRVKVTQQQYSLAGAWRATQGRTPLDLIAGMRYNSIEPRLETRRATRSDTKDAWDPFIGARVQVPLSQRWTLVGYADVGQFGGDPAWQALAGVNYAFNDKVIGKLGYRRYQVDYDKNNFKYDSAMYGIYVGVGFRF
jgi:opacity protein-like surface antigen